MSESCIAENKWKNIKNFDAIFKNNLEIRNLMWWRMNISILLG